MIKEEAKGRGRRGDGAEQSLAEAFTLFDDHYVHTLLFPPTHARDFGHAVFISATTCAKWARVPGLALAVIN